MDDTKKEGNDGTAVTVRHCRRGNGGTYTLYDGDVDQT
jgi:hypothetical protein